MKTTTHLLCRLLDFSILRYRKASPVNACPVPVRSNEGLVFVTHQIFQGPEGLPMFCATESVILPFAGVRDDPTLHHKKNCLKL